MAYRLQIKNTYPGNKRAANRAKWRLYGGFYQTKSGVQKFKKRTIPQGVYLTRIVKRKK